MASVPPPLIGPLPFALNNQTIRQVLHLSAGGHRLRVRLTNEYGSKPLTIGAATIARVNADGSVDRSSLRKLTFCRTTVGGDSRLGAAAQRSCRPAGQGPLGRVAESVFPRRTPDFAPAISWRCRTDLSPRPGDFTASEFTAAQTVQSRAFVSGVEVEVAHGKTIVVLGDSISDGVGSTPNANRRWPDVFARRLNHGSTAWGVANQGISGNRILEDGAGQSALARLDRDVLALPGVAYLIVFEGVNDLGVGFGKWTLPPGPDNAPPPVIVSPVPEAHGGSDDRRISPDHRPRSRTRHQGVRRDHRPVRGSHVLVGRGRIATQGHQ